MLASPALPLAPSALTDPPRFATARKPDGGFLWLPVPLLLTLWLGYQHKQLRALELRGMLACLEMVARRCQKDPDVAAHYGPDELATLLGIPPPQARTVLQHLVAHGLLTWTTRQLTVTATPEQLPWLDQTTYQARLATLPSGLQRLPFPRRLNRWLVQHARPGLIGLTLGVSLRCLRYTEGACRVGGSVPLAALHRSLGLHERCARRHLRTLERLGWLTPVPTAPWHQQQHGRWYLPTLTWATPPVPTAATTRPPVRRLGRPRQLPLPFPMVPAVPSSPAPEPPAPHEDEVQVAVSVPTAVPVPTAVSLPTVSPAVEPTAAPPATRLIATVAQETLSHEALAARARESLQAQGFHPDFLIAPVIADEVARLQQTLADSSAPAPTPPLPAAPADTTDTQQAAPLQDKVAAPLQVKVAAPVLRSHEKSTPFSSFTSKPLREKPQSQLATSATTPGVAPGAGDDRKTLPLPTWDHIVPEDLTDLARLEGLYEQAITRGWLPRSAATWLTCVTAAVHARQRGRDPGALFRYVICQQDWEVLTNSEEDAARAWLRRQQGEPERPPPSPEWEPAPAIPALPPEAQFVRDAQRLLRAQGWTDDPWRLVVQQYPAWTRARWDAALATLEHWQLTQVQAQAAWRAAQAGEADAWDDGDPDPIEDDDDAY